jgi:hypothetical protein
MGAKIKLLMPCYNGLKYIERAIGLLGDINVHCVSLTFDSNHSCSIRRANASARFSRFAYDVE